MLRQRLNQPVVLRLLVPKTFVPQGSLPRFAHLASYYKHCKARLIRALGPALAGHPRGTEATPPHPPPSQAAQCAPGFGSIVRYRHARAAGGGPISGAGSTSLIIDPIELSDAGDYYCEVTDDFGSASSSPVSLIVTAAMPAAGGLARCRRGSLIPKAAQRPSVRVSRLMHALCGYHSVASGFVAAWTCQAFTT